MKKKKLPSSGAGIVQYFDEKVSKTTFTPNQVITITILLIFLVLITGCSLQIKSTNTNNSPMPDYQKARLIQGCLQDCTKGACQTVNGKTVCNQDLRSCELECTRKYGQ